MSLSTKPERRLVMSVDIEDYSSRDDDRQHHLQSHFPAIMAAAADECGLDREGWTIQSTGDGEVAVFPAGVSEPQVIARLVPALDRELRARNRHAADGACIRLRAALHQGLVWRTPNGFAGSAVVAVCRLVDASALREELRRFRAANVALIVSDTLYQDVVAQSYPGIRRERFKPATVAVKSFAAKGWIYVPDENVNAGVDADGGLPGGPSSGTPTPASGDDRRTDGWPDPARTVGDPASAPGGGSRFQFGSVTNNAETIYGDHARQTIIDNPSNDAR